MPRDRAAGYSWPPCACGHSYHDHSPGYGPGQAIVMNYIGCHPECVSLDPIVGQCGGAGPAGEYLRP